MPLWKWQEVQTMLRSVLRSRRGRSWGEAAKLAGWVCLAALLAFSLTRRSDMLLRWELATLDMRFRHRGPRPPDPRILIVGIDEESLRTYGPFPWPRWLYAQAVETLTAAGAKAIVFDILLSDPSPVALWDQMLAEAMARSGRVFLAGHALGEKGVGPDGLWEYEAFQGPVPLLARSAVGVGAVTYAPDPDAIYRRANLLLRCGGREVAALMLQVALWVRGIPPQAFRRLSDGTLQMGNVRLPTNLAARLLLDYAGGHGTYPLFPFAQVLQGQVPPETFRDKIVLLGAIAPGLQDLRANPFSPVFYAVEANANLLDNLLNDRYLRPAPPWWTLWVTLVLALLTAGPLGILSLKDALLGSLFLNLLYAALCIWLFEGRGWVWEMVAPLGGSLMASGVVLGRRLLLMEQEQRRLQQQFQVYVPPHVLASVLENPGVLQLGGTRREVTVLFADIRGFTALSELLQPEQVVDLLNEYFSAMTDIIFKFEGMVDKFIGDQIMAVFNVPLIQGDHALRAVKAALQMQQRLQQLHRRWVKEGKPCFTIGIGIETGVVVVGNIGSDRRMDYSVIGDAVNVAARLEELCRDLGADILIGERTYQRVKDVVQATPIGEVLARGRLTPLRAYRVEGLKEE